MISSLYSTGIIPDFWRLFGDFTDTYFRVHVHSFYDLSVINGCFSQTIRSLLVAGVAGVHSLLFISEELMQHDTADLLKDL